MGMVAQMGFLITKIQPAKGGLGKMFGGVCFTNSRYAKVRNYIVNRSEASIKCLFFTKLPLRITNSA